MTEVEGLTDLRSVGSNGPPRRVAKVYSLATARA